MAPILIFGIALVSGGLLALTLAVTATVDPVQQRTLGNLHRGIRDEGAEKKERSLLTELSRTLTPPPLARLIGRLHGKAGRPASWPPERIYTFKLLTLVFTSLLTILLATRFGNIFLVLAALAFVGLTYFTPELLLLSKSIERSRSVLIELADTLDQMTIAVEAGLGFDAALAHASQNGRGVLAEEIIRTLQDIQMGQSRRQAFESLAQRSDVVELGRFVRAINQADEHGISLGDVLRTQAAEMRVKRRQRAEEKAMKIPVKVVLPLILCILPVLFIVVVGPAALQIASFFSTM